MANLRKVVELNAAERAAQARQRVRVRLDTLERQMDAVLERLAIVPRDSALEDPVTES